MIKQRFALDDAATDELIEKATAAEHESVDLYHFTQPAQSHARRAGRARIIEMMWEIVYADGRRDELEDNLLWRAADLLGVSPRERIELRRRIGGEDAERRRRRAHEAGHADHRRVGRDRHGTGARLCRARSRLVLVARREDRLDGAGRRDRGDRAGRGRRCWPSTSSGATRSRARRGTGVARARARNRGQQCRLRTERARPPCSTATNSSA